MFDAYVQRATGEVLHVPFRHIGHHLTTNEGQARSASLHWQIADAAPEHRHVVETLLEVVPLMDTLVLTRGTPQDSRGVRQVFSGLVVESGSDGVSLKLTARDDPEQAKLHEQVFRFAEQNGARVGAPAAGAGWARVGALEQAPAGPQVPVARPAGAPGEGGVVVRPGGPVQAAQ